MPEMKLIEHIGSDVLSRYSMTFGTMDKIPLHLYKTLYGATSQELHGLDFFLLLVSRGP